MNNMKRLATIASACLLLAACARRPKGDPRLQGKWYYSEAPASYMEFSGDGLTEHLGEMGAEVTYGIQWTDSAHYTLLVKTATGPAAAVYSPGDRLEVQVEELTAELFQFHVTGIGRSDCIYVVRHPGSKAVPSMSCWNKRWHPAQQKRPAGMTSPGFFIPCIARRPANPVPPAGRAGCWWKTPNNGTGAAMRHSRCLWEHQRGRGAQLGATHT